MLIQQPDFQQLVGTVESVQRSSPDAIFNETTLDFFAELSSDLLENPLARDLPDLITFGFWCRKSNLEKLRQQYLSPDEFRFGRGVAFHITPSNVPINFAFSFAFSLLSGNSNVVRVPTKKFPQIDVFISSVQKLFRLEKFANLALSNCFVRYEQNPNTTALLSSICDVRVVWGGDDAIKSIREIPLSPRCISLEFADRYSASFIDSKSFVNATSEVRDKLTLGFFNDVFLFDQNACSSPRSIFWFGSEETTIEAKAIFWPLLEKLVWARYQIADVNLISKFVDFCRIISQSSIQHSVKRSGNLIYRLSITDGIQDLTTLENRFGTFFEGSYTSLDELPRIFNSKFQTITQFGFEADAIKNFITRHRPPGINRIVPFGTALDMNLNWDGYDVVRTLSRNIEVR